ncbi:hypothetical protein V496_01279 [Pseudogymnoascus sp. VKM F-4515 (FW-2607)]|nr:hypothetical protein V496_01279 [Pseudogymnoascus sp. VKM F-4515 (FW-2607)]
MSRYNSVTTFTTSHDDTGFCPRYYASRPQLWHPRFPPRNPGCHTLPSADIPLALLRDIPNDLYSTHFQLPDLI